HPPAVTTGAAAAPDPAEASGSALLIGNGGNGGAGGTGLPEGTGGTGGTGGLLFGTPGMHG
ncbi:hypothetical protein OSI29_18050, partial [Mycobacterium ulcerans]